MAWTFQSCAPIATAATISASCAGVRRLATKYEFDCPLIGDLSLGGMSAVSQIPLNRGERVTFFFPPQGAMRGWDAYGRVVRCDPSAMGYRVAVEFDPLPAA